MTWEKMMTALVDMGSRVDLAINAGMIGTGMALSLAQLVILNVVGGLALVRRR